MIYFACSNAKLYKDLKGLSHTIQSIYLNLDAVINAVIAPFKFIR
jgi:hypothetical protein